MRPVPTLLPDRSALPLATPPASRWERMPPAQRQRLLWLLSQLLTRHLALVAAPREEDGHDADPRPR